MPNCEEASRVIECKAGHTAQPVSGSWFRTWEMSHQASLIQVPDPNRVILAAGCRDAAVRPEGDSSQADAVSLTRQYEVATAGVPDTKPTVCSGEQACGEDREQ